MMAEIKPGTGTQIYLDLMKKRLTRFIFPEKRPSLPFILYASKLMEHKRCIDLANAYVATRPVPDARKAYLLTIGDGKKTIPVPSRLEETGEKDVRFLGFKKLVTAFENNFALKPNVLAPCRLTVSTSRVYTSDETGSLTTEYFERCGSVPG